MLTSQFSLVLAAIGVGLAMGGMEVAGKSGHDPNNYGGVHARISASRELYTDDRANHPS